MQASKNNEVMESMTGELEKLTKRSSELIKSGEADHVTIANFYEGETIELRGIKFKISSNNQQAKRLTLHML